VVNDWSDDVTKLRASDGKVLDTFKVGDYPQSACFDGENIWVANAWGDTVTKIRP
jgi:DNA-binding beta-propeller fold protein YncE